jgi:hypothetical protein
MLGNPPITIVDKDSCMLAFLCIQADELAVNVSISDSVQRAICYSGHSHHAVESGGVGGTGQVGLGKRADPGGGGRKSYPGRVRQTGLVL